MVNEDALRHITDPQFREVCRAVVGAMGRLPAPGVIVGIVNGEQEFTAGFGVTNINHPMPVTEDTLFQIGSITKLYTATALMRLVEQEQIALDAPLRERWPDLRLADENTAARATLRHLLTHTGGWAGDYFYDFGPGDDALALMAARVAELPQITPLGEVWSYSNTGYYLAGRLLEILTGKTYPAAIKELVFDPLGLDMSFFFARDVVTHRFAVGHNFAEGQLQVARPWELERAAHPSGGVVCRLGDLLRFARFHMGDGAAPGGTRLLAPERLALMQTPMLPASGLSMIGLGWLITTIDGEKIIEHSGATNGQNAEIQIAPGRGFAVAVCANSNAGGLLCRQVSEAALKIYAGLVAPEAGPLDLPPETLAEYAGRYSSSIAVGDLKLENGQLMLHVTFTENFAAPGTPPPPSLPPMPVGLYAEDRVIVLDGPMKDLRGEFIRRPGGQIGWLRIAGRLHVKEAAE
jgi:CubicO group peptidase (beta-lactamase class C family)